MTTLEIVEAVQRSLENEGYLQAFRAQLRANVLRIVASGPNYVPKSGKVVTFGQQRTGSLALHLVKDLLLYCDMRETLAIFEAESGNGDRIDNVAVELGLQEDSNHCLLEVLIMNALNGSSTQSRAGPAEGKWSEAEETATKHHTPQILEVQLQQADASPLKEPDSEEEESVPEDQYEQDDSFVDEGEGYSAIDAPALRQQPPRATSASPDQPQHIFASAKSAVATHSRLDESSSFEADSPAKGGAAAGKAFTPLEDSFAESVEEEEDQAEEGQQKELSGTGDRDESKGVAKDVGPEEDEDEEVEETGPEYDSDGRHEAEAMPKPGAMQQHVREAEAESQEKAPYPYHRDSSQDSSKDTSSKESSEDHEDEDDGEHSGGGAALQPARAQDFDRLDREEHDSMGGSSGGGGNGSARNRIAVRRANMASSAGGDAEPGSHTGPGRANVNRLGQGAVSRSQSGWSTSETHQDDDFGSHSDEDEFAQSPVGAGPRRSRQEDMETESFEEDGSPAPTSRPRRQESEVRRSNNQEEEEEEEENDYDGGKHAKSDEESLVEDFEQDGSGSEDEFEYGDTSYKPTASAAPGAAARAATLPPSQVRNAFASPEKEESAVKGTRGEHSVDEEQNEEEDEYADEDFDEVDEALDEVNQGRGAAAPVVNQNLFAPSAVSNTRKPPVKEDSSVDSVEEESIPDEEEEEEDADGMSVGQASDEDSGDGDFRHVVAGKGKLAPQSQRLQQDTLSRATRSGVLPGVSKSAAGKSANFDAVLNSFEDSDAEEDQPASAKSGYNPSITARMREIDSQLEDMERTDSKGELVGLRRKQEQRGGGAGDSSSVASENIDDMEFSTGGGQEDSSESSGEGSFSFLDSSSKK